MLGRGGSPVNENVLRRKNEHCHYGEYKTKGVPLHVMDEGRKRVLRRRGSRGW
jgi:hypothetical protein